MLCSFFLVEIVDFFFLFYFIYVIKFEVFLSYINKYYIDLVLGY